MQDFNYPNICEESSVAGTRNTDDSELTRKVILLDLLSTIPLVQEPLLRSTLGLQFLPELML